MVRLKFLFVAVVVAGLGAVNLLSRAPADDARIRQAADERLRASPQAVLDALQLDAQAAVVSAKAVAQNAAVGQSMDDHGKPTAEALETARATLEKAQGLSAERPVLLALSAQGMVWTLPRRAEQPLRSRP